MIDVIRAGLLTTIQDLGRHGFRHLGVAMGGALDRLSLEVGNRRRGDVSVVGEVLLGPCQKRPGGTGLGRGEVTRRGGTGLFHVILFI